ncbi:(2Fe-2S) ferredoxin domain-containing protein [Actinomadura syzygii]|uniref:(2Fe-2S) ferredoxin domain-containing protein n=1 Tax=Actinomadura syzygii TaxID=1427538 RepID=A0A5D0U8L8_9ACTN|nr:(2Fe-2S) ferredoxin domain-containing protein [Actinomadura syzygii]TYC14324.1 (2Fe-2S) ferredoxin domain-containing protein [Actinomadura syzygii]
MSARTGGPPAARAPQPRCTVTVCRGCCCGTDRRNPGIDHDVLERRLRRQLAHDVRVRYTDCLGPCTHANIIVINPSAAGRAAGGRTTWIGHVLDTGAVDDITAWANAGGPGMAEPPATIDLYAFKPPRHGH